MSDTIIVTTKEVLEELIHGAIKTALKENLPEALQQAIAKPYLTKNELMELTGWSARQVEYKKTSREIPFIRRGRLILFPTQDIYEYLEKGRVPARKNTKY